MKREEFEDRFRACQEVPCLLDPAYQHTVYKKLMKQRETDPEYQSPSTLAKAALEMGWAHIGSSPMDSRLAAFYGGRTEQHVTTLHGQFVASPGRDVRIVAYAPDGTPEAIEVGTDPAFGMLGVQWHAEVPPWDARQRPLFAAFRDAVFAAAD